MSWFLNKYHCPSCNNSWENAWSCKVGDECAFCRRDYEPEGSDNLTVIVQPTSQGLFEVLCSPRSAEDKPMYEEVFVGTKQQCRERLNAYS